jgi:hypothetical protein
MVCRNLPTPAATRSCCYAVPDLSHKRLDLVRFGFVRVTLDKSQLGLNRALNALALGVIGASQPARLPSGPPMRPAHPGTQPHTRCQRPSAAP